MEDQGGDETFQLLGERTHGVYRTDPPTDMEVPIGPVPGRPRCRAAAGAPQHVVLKSPQVGADEGPWLIR